MDIEKELRVKRSIEKGIPQQMICNLQHVDDVYIKKVKEKYNLPTNDCRRAFKGIR